MRVKNHPLPDLEKILPALALSILVALYAVICYERNDIWLNEKTLWQDVVSKSPYKSRGYTYLGIAYAKDKDFAEAEENLLRAVSINPTNVETRYNLGVFYIDMKRYDLAKREFSVVLELRPDLTETYLALARVYTLEGDYAASAKILEKSSNIWKEDMSMRLDLGFSNARSGKLAEAETDFKAVLEKNPNTASALNGLGNIYLMNGKYEEALSQYIKATRALPSNPEPLFNSAMALERLGRKKEALEYYERFIAAATPEYSDAAKKARQKVETLKGASLH
ncbi:MAG: tetratricopeptide repeat protein [Deltaproteobacteria bacterium]|nr:tetratricopeptide repeat protein [Deltaproteobacteria bacterium]